MRPSHRKAFGSIEAGNIMPLNSKDGKKITMESMVAKDWPWAIVPIRRPIPILVNRYIINTAKYSQGLFGIVE